MNVEINSRQFNHFIKQSKLINTDSIIIDASDVVELIKCDVENQISTIIDANVFEKGTVKIPNEVFPLIKDNEIMSITNENIRVGSRSIKLDMNNDSNYFKIDDNFIYNVFELNDKDLKQLLEVEHAISTDLTKPILNSIRIDCNRFIAIDGYRMSQRDGEFKSDIPITIGNYKILKALKGNIKATCSDKYIKYQVDNYNYYSRLIDGDFIAFDKLKPRESNTEVTINRDELLDILNSIKNLTTKVKNQLVKFAIRDNSITIFATNKTNSKKNKDEEKKELSIKFEDSVKCNTTGDYLDIAFNCNYLIDSVKKMDKQIKMSFTTNVNPVVITSPGKYELILPVRVASTV